MVVTERRLRRLWVSTGQSPGGGLEPSAVIDAVNAKLLVVTDNTANGHRSALFRCNLDGTACTYTGIEAGQGLECGLSPSALVDKASGDLLVVTANRAAGHRLGFFQVGLR